METEAGEAFPKLYTAREAGELIGVSIDVIDRFVREGKLSYVDLGTGSRRRARYRKSDLVALIDSLSKTEKPLAVSDPMERRRSA
jgi:predicted site-specific integrase-resolvase